MQGRAGMQGPMVVLRMLYQLINQLAAGGHVHACICLSVWTGHCTRISATVPSSVCASIRRGPSDRDPYSHYSSSILSLISNARVINNQLGVRVYLDPPTNCIANYYINRQWYPYMLENLTQGYEVIRSFYVFSWDQLGSTSQSINQLMCSDIHIS